jgi:hypothetical protein
MNDTDRRLWPFRPRASLISAAVLLVGLLLLVAVLRASAGWPSAQSENAVLIGVLLLSLLPILLALLDVIIERGTIIEYAGVKVNFSQSRDTGTPSITVASNIGVRGEPISSSHTTRILDALKDALKQATTSDVVIIDLEDGHRCQARLRQKTKGWPSILPQVCVTSCWRSSCLRAILERKWNRGEGR